MAPDGIATFNSFGYITFLNKAFCSLTGFCNNELIGQHLTKMQTLCKRDLLRYLKIFSSIIRGNISPPAHGVYNKKDGTKGVVEGYLGLIDMEDKRET